MFFRFYNNITSYTPTIQDGIIMIIIDADIDMTFKLL